MEKYHQVRISGITLARRKLRKNGDHVIAEFDFSARGFSFEGCLLVLSSGGDHFMQFPRAAHTNSATAVVRIADSALRNEVRAAAVAAYEHFTRPE